MAEITASTVERVLLLETAGTCTGLSSHFLTACPEQTGLDKIFLLAL